MSPGRANVLGFSIRPGFPARVESLFTVCACASSGKAEETPETFTGHQHEIVTRPVHEAAQPRLYRRRIRRIADGDHRTRDSIGT